MKWELPGDPWREIAKYQQNVMLIKAMRNFIKF